MSESTLGQSLNIAGSVLETVQIGGMAGRDLNLNQIHGGVGAINVFGLVQVDPAPINAAKPINQQEHRWRRVLLDKVKQFWIDGILTKSLHTQALIELGLEEHSEFVQSPLSGVDEFPTESRQKFPGGTAAADIFEGIGAGRTLLILGEPGAGKTVTLLKLAESLLARTENDLSQPLPVVMNLSSWAKQRKSIADWLVQELYEIYGASKSLGKVWVDQGQLILLLDGLDEVKAQYRNECVKALNQFIQEHGLTELVVCSRIRDYESLSERLKLRSAIYVQPLTSQQVDQFLERAGESLSALKNALQHNAEIRTFASSPLILSIMSLAYQNCSSETIPQIGTSEEHLQRLFDTYIDRMFIRRGTTEQYSREQTLQWLTWLAQRMVGSSQTVFLIERLQPSWLSNREQRIIYRLISSFMAGLPICLISGFSIGLIGTLRFGLNRGISLGLVSGFLSGFVGGMIVGAKGEINSFETLKFSWQALKENLYSVLMHGFIGGLVVFLLFQLIFGEHEEAIHGVVNGGIWGLFTAIISGFISGLRGPEIQQSGYPNQGIWKSARNANIFSISVGLLFGLISRIISGPMSGLISGLRDGLIFWPGVVCIGGLIGGGADCIRHAALRLLFYRMGYSPQNYARFLDYATDRLFLQKVGGGYIFIHRMLLEHFAQMKL